MNRLVELLQTRTHADGLAAATAPSRQSREGAFNTAFNIGRTEICHPDRFIEKPGNSCKCFARPPDAPFDQIGWQLVQTGLAHYDGGMLRRLDFVKPVLL